MRLGFEWEWELEVEFAGLILVNSARSAENSYIFGMASCKLSLRENHDLTYTRAGHNRRDAKNNRSITSKAFE